MDIDHTQRKEQLSNFTKVLNNNESGYYPGWQKYKSILSSKDYPIDKVTDIVNSGTLDAKIDLSRNYFNRGGFYSSIILYYTTLLKFLGVLIPNDKKHNGLKSNKAQKKYYQALDFIESANVPQLCYNWTMKVLRDGAYYGILTTDKKKNIISIDLPVKYCSSDFKDAQGNQIVTFNVNYFDTIIDEATRKEVIKSYPKIIGRYYYNLKQNKITNPWMDIPSDIVVHFSLFNEIPYFLSTIPVTIQYEDSIEIERDKELEEIKKIIVQKIPHLQDGRLLFEPDEAEEMHRGTVNMLRGNPNISVLTSYADVDSIISKTTADTGTTISEKMANSIYANAGVSGHLFSLAGTASLKNSIYKDIALMMTLANSYSCAFTKLINSCFKDKTIDFKYNILPISFQTEKDYIDNSFKMVSLGYSFTLPALALGLTQKDLVNIKEMENNVLKLSDKLLSLSSSYQTSPNEPGAPAKEPEEKEDTTLVKEESIDNQGGTK